MITSSEYPNRGIKSGIKSMGDNAYAIVMPHRAFTNQGVSLSLSAIKTV